jgi:hypothetical protein
MTPWSRAIHPDAGMGPSTYGRARHTVISRHIGERAQTPGKGLLTSQTPGNGPPIGQRL